MEALLRHLFNHPNEARFAIVEVLAADLRPWPGETRTGPMVNRFSLIQALLSRSFM
jgi:hypothetical protein